MAALVVIGATLAGERPAIAGTFSGIILTGGVTEGGDPQYTYYIDVYLENDTIPAYPNSGPPTATINITDLTGIDSTDLYQLNYQTYQPPAALWTETITPNMANFDFFGTSPNTAGPDPVYLFQFIIQTPHNVIGKNPGDRVDYTWTISGQQGSGFFILNAVPEPSSILMMAAGAVVLPYLEIRRRRRARRVA
jgi:hypothetical protein